MSAATTPRPGKKARPVTDQTDPMPIKALAAWLGGKRTLGPRIAAEGGKHTQYFSWFFGSGADLFAKQPSQKETVCDMHGDVTNLARCLQVEEHAIRLWDRMNRLVLSEAVLRDCIAALETGPAPEPDGPLNPDRAFYWLAAAWMGRSGTSGTERPDQQIAVRWTKNGGSPTVRLLKVAESIPAWHRRLQNVAILNRDAFDFIPKMEDTKGTFAYLDPPYPPEVRTSFEREVSGGGRYLHEFKHESSGAALFGGGVDDDDDHTRLAKMLRQFKHARIVVSCYDCPRYRRLYDGWTFVDCTMRKNLSASGGQGNAVAKANEVLIINGKSHTIDSALWNQPEKDDE